MTDSDKHELISLMKAAHPEPKVYRGDAAMPEWMLAENAEVARNHIRGSLPTTKPASERVHLIWWPDEVETPIWVGEVGHRMTLDEYNSRLRRAELDRLHQMHLSMVNAEESNLAQLTEMGVALSKEPK
jgi:hypothetical protein